MFTGLIETTGTLRARDQRGPGFRIRVQTGLQGLRIGDSVAVSGACLTVVERASGSFDADVSTETVEKTTLGRIRVGSDVNLERSLVLGDRLGGHLVTGHVDGVAVVRDVTTVGETLRVTVVAPRDLMRFIAAKGSVALDGVSLTVNALAPDGVGFEILLIPHTLSVTNFGCLAAGTELNLEVDLVARYVSRLLDMGSLDADAGLRTALDRAGRLS